MSNNSILTNYPFKHWELANIPFGAKVAIYGTGEIAKVFFIEQMSAKRHDIQVCFFLDSRKNGSLYNKSIHKYNSNNVYDVDYIIIASMFWPNIIKNINKEQKVAIYKYNQNRYKLAIVDSEKKIIFRRNARTGSGDVARMMFSEGAKQSIIDITDPIYQDYFTFSFVRHPTVKFLSAYYLYIIEDMKLDFSVSPGIDFSPVLSALEISMKKPRIDDFINKYMLLDEQIRDPHFWGQKLHLGPNLDFVGKLETMSEDMNQLSKLTGSYNTHKLKHTSPKTIDDYKASESIDVLKSIESIFEEDFQEYSYIKLTN